jgi:hypothetical protein
METPEEPQIDESQQLEQPSEESQPEQPSEQPTEEPEQPSDDQVAETPEVERPDPLNRNKFKPEAHDQQAEYDALEDERQAQRDEHNERIAPGGGKL